MIDKQTAADNRRVQAHQRDRDDQRQYWQWYNSPEGKRQYIRKAYANGAEVFDPDKYELATGAGRDLEEIKKKALANVRHMFQKEIPMNEQEFNVLMRIANALEAMVQATAPAAPNYQFPFEEYPNFDWSRINATVVAADEYGATAVNWNGHTWKRRSWPQKYGLVVGFTRPDGMGEDGVNWLNLIAFKEMTPVEPLDSKVTQALASQRKPAATPASTNGRKQQKAKPGTLPHVEEGSVTSSRLADLRAAIEEHSKGTTLGFVAEKAAQSGLYKNSHHAMKTIGNWPDLPEGVAVTFGKSVTVSTALAIYDWLASRKDIAADVVDEANSDLFAE